MAEALIEHGAHAALVVRNPEKAEAKLAPLLASGRAAVFQADAVSKTDLLRVAGEIDAWAPNGRSDILLHTAGTNSATAFFDITEEEWNAIMDVNAKSVMLACQVFGRSMIDAGQGGSIITISSVSSGPPLSRVFAYSASKHAVNSMTQYLAKEFAPHGIRVNGIVPGFFRRSGTARSSRPSGWPHASAMRRWRASATRRSCRARSCGWLRKRLPVTYRAR